MSIKRSTFWVAVAGAAMTVAAGILGTMLLVGPLSQLRFPAMLCGDGACVRITPTEPATTDSPSPGPDVIGMTCPEGQHWVDGIHGAYCSPAG